jgi:hypothetical protein
MGSKLKAAIKILKEILYFSITSSGTMIFSLIVNGKYEDTLKRATSNRILMKERIMFVAGPAAETRAESLRGFLRLLKATGTGLAEPNIKLPFERINSIIGTRTVPIGSICAIGFKVSLPIIFAVGSPSLYAVYP